MINEILNLELFDAEDIAAKLYDPAEPGALVIEDFLDEEFRRKLLEEIKKGTYQEALREYGKARQGFSQIVNENIKQNEFPLVHRLKYAYSQLYRQLAEEAQFQSNNINDVYMQRYPEGSIGITPHLDFKSEINLVSIFVIEGKGDFYVCSDREKRNSQLLENPSGSLILIRAPRKPEENILRPMHYLENVTEERYTISFREKNVQI